jgi:5'(3')-deoxyribonucleotidase
VTRAFLDIDGVLADFTAGVHKKLGIPFDYNKWPYKFGPEGWYFHEEIGMTFNQLSDICDFDFWANLPWCPDGKAILDAVLGLVQPDQITLLTMPMPHVMSASGKVAWIENHMPDFKWRMMICLDKKRILAQVPDAILIDDCQKNIDQWRAAGGRAVLVPRPWNNLYKRRDIATTMVRAVLESELHQMQVKLEAA